MAIQVTGPDEWTGVVTDWADLEYGAYAGQVAGTTCGVFLAIYNAKNDRHPLLVNIKAPRETWDCSGGGPPISLRPVDLDVTASYPRGV